MPPKRPRGAEPWPRDRGRSGRAATPLARLDLRGTVTRVESRDPRPDCARAANADARPGEPAIYDGPLALIVSFVLPITSRQEIVP